MIEEDGKALAAFKASLAASRDAVQKTLDGLETEFERYL